MRSKSAVVLATAALILTTGVVPTAAESEFEKWQRERRGEFRSYIEKRDAEFAKFLETAWIEMRAQRGVVRDPAPKPVDIPVAPPAPRPAPAPPPVRPQPRPQPAPPPAPVRPEPRPEPSPPPVRPQPRPTPPPPPVQPRPRPEPTPPPAPVRPQPRPTPPPAPTPGSARPLQFDYFGQSVNLATDPKLATALPPGAVDNRRISEYWTSVSTAQYQPVLEQFDAERRRLELNDWGYLLLLHRFAETLHATREADRALLVWFLLSKAGYHARVGYEEDKVYLLLPTRQRLYDVTYVTLEDTRFYGVTFDGRKRRMKQVYTYDGNYPDATRVLNLRLERGPRTQPRIKTRVLRFKYDNREYEIPARYNENIVEFLSTYPQMDLAMYSEFEPRRESLDALLASLRRAIDGKSELEAANIILRFVQTAFRYATDDVQFGQENYLFPEETLFFPQSDCEDRSILYSLLVRKLLGLETVFVTFPGHVATAIGFRDPGSATGEVYTYKNRRYVLADPTYINASVGMKMPQYAQVTGEIVTLER